MSVQCVTIGDDEVVYRIVLGESTMSVGIKHLEQRPTCVDERIVTRTHERLVHIEARYWK